ncbi:MAG: peptidylprolyl isomerase [Chitinophagaceae bacterium]|jgi:cyclophilin family peptidyl-prolyl cis-trans isomerase
MKKFLLLSLLAFFIGESAMSQADSIIKKRDRKKDILLETSKGNIHIRLSNETPLHRDNFIKLVKMHYYDGILFHRVIERFMIQSGDPDSRTARPGQPLGEGGPSYTIPAEFRPNLFHKKGVIAAARDNNPEKASSASQFYLTQGKVFTEAGLDSLETNRLKRKIPVEHRKVYTTLGGVPHLDQNYTVFGEVVKGLSVVDSIAAVPTSKGADKDRPLEDVKIIKAKLVKRKKG